MRRKRSGRKKRRIKVRRRSSGSGGNADGGRKSSERTDAGRPDIGRFRMPRLVWKSRLPGLAVGAHGGGKGGIDVVGVEARRFVAKPGEAGTEAVTRMEIANVALERKSRTE